MTTTALRPAPIREAAHLLDPYLTRLDDFINPFAQHAAAEIRAALDATGASTPAAVRTTMRKWMQAHDGQPVTTIQVHNRTGEVWAPIHRTIEAARATYVTFDGSRSDYDGSTVVAATETALIVNNGWHTTAYIIETPTATNP